METAGMPEQGGKQFPNMEPMKVSERDPRIPVELANWKNMTDEELEKAFEKTSKDFQDRVYRYLSKTETNIRWLLSDLTKSGGKPVFGFKE